MDTTVLITKSWAYIWRSKALWLFGALLALTTYNSVFWMSSNYSQDQPADVPVRIGDEIIIWLPGEGLEIDITRQEGIQVTIDGNLINLSEGLERFIVIQDQELRPILVFSLTWFGIIAVLGLVVRYVSETALIRMVDQEEETGQVSSVGEGFLLGWSLRAAKLFLVDVLIFSIFFILFAAAFSLIILPILFGSLDGFSSVFLVGLGALGLTLILGVVFFAAAALLSFILQLVRRACVVDNQGVFAAFSTALRILRTRFRDIGLVWLIWVFVRIIWAPLSVLIAIMLFPLLLAMLVLGVFVGGVFALTAGVVANAFLGNFASLVIALVFAGPIVLFIASLPLVIAGGGVEIMKSALWTLAYRETHGFEFQPAGVSAAERRSPAASSLSDAPTD